MVRPVPATDKEQLTSSHIYLLCCSIYIFSFLSFVQSRYTTDIKMTAIATLLTVLLAAIFTRLASYICQLLLQNLQVLTSVQADGVLH